MAGSVEALRSSIEALQQEDETTVCRPDIVFCGVGDVTSSDVSIAQVGEEYELLSLTYIHTYMLFFDVRFRKQRSLHSMWQPAIMPWRMPER